MVLISNGILSDGNVVRSGKENGSCSTNEASNLPLKWKPREVSAVRVFPQGCGPIVQPVSVVSREVSAVRVFPRGCGPIVQPVSVVSQEPDALLSLVSSNNGANDAGPSGTLVESAEDGSGGLIVEPLKELHNGDYQAVSKEEVSGSFNAVVKMDDVMPLSPTHRMDNGAIVIKEAKPNTKFPQRRVSAIREFPPFCGLNSTKPTDEGHMRINGMGVGTKDECGGRNLTLTEAMVAGAEESKGTVKDEFLQKTHSVESSGMSPTENQETGSTVKDLMEGKVEGERLAGKMIGVGEESNIDVQDGEFQMLGHDATEVDPKNGFYTNPQKGHEAFAGQTCQELVVYKRDKVLKRRCSDDAHGEDSEGTNADVCMLNCESQEMVVIPYDLSQAPFQEDFKNISGQLMKVGHEKRSKNRPSDATNNLGFVGEERRVVLGLMASRPWKSVEENLINIDDNTKTSKGNGTDCWDATNDLGLVEEDRRVVLGLMASPVHPQRNVEENLISVNDNTKTSMENGTDCCDATSNLGFVGEKRRVVLGLMASPVYPQKSVEENLINVDYNTNTSKGNGTTSITPKKSVKRKAGYGRKVVQGGSSSSREKVAYSDTLDMVVGDEEDFVVDAEEYPTSHKAHYVDVMPLPFGPKSSNDARNKVRETLRFFQVICRKLLQGEEAKTREGDESESSLPIRRVDLAARTILLKQGRVPDRGKKTYGPIPGVEVGDEFQYRVELALVGIHWRLQEGIDYVKQGRYLVAVSVVASGSYDNELGKPDCLTYSGSGGTGKDKKVEDQKLDKGNLALKNNIQLKVPVRVIRGYKSKTTEPSDLKSRVSSTYIYDGLYTVEDYWQEAGPHGNLVFKFELKRIPGQPELALREVKSKKFKTRAGLCADDISGGKEEFRICAFNTVDDEKPPSFNYITKIVYPDWYCIVPPEGCDCVGRCSDKRCSCAFKNGGEIPYNHNGAIVEAKPLVYECGPSCTCPPSCYNRVTQHGMKIQFEIFKTESRGWGVRSLSSIASGSFICEYIGELLEDTEAEKRTSNDEYLFDIGQNYNDCSVNPDTKSSSTEVEGAGGFTIDAANYGNVGRFINHSCSPNLYAQNVLYDQEDKRMPHIMLFAADNIPPLQELTYHYNYAVDTVHDSDGNIKIKNCYCGSSECTGRLY